MALDYNINIYETDNDDSEKTMVTFVVKDQSKDKSFVVTKKITTGSKTKEEILEEAYSESQPNVDEWQETLTVIGKNWNPSTSKIV